MNSISASDQFRTMGTLRSEKTIEFFETEAKLSNLPNLANLPNLPNSVKIKNPLNI